MTQRTGARAATLELIRTGLVTGVLLIAIVAWLVHRDAGPAGSADLLILRWVVYALMVVAVVATVVLRFLIARAPTPERAASLTILSWCFAEAPAAAGALHYLITGSAALFALGTLLFVAALLFTGIPQSVNSSRLSSR